MYCNWNEGNVIMLLVLIYATQHSTSQYSILTCAKAPLFRTIITSLARLVTACQVFICSGPPSCTYPMPPPSCNRAQGHLQPREQPPNTLGDNSASFSPATYSRWSESLIAWSHPRLPAASKRAATAALAPCVGGQIDTGKWRLLGMAPQTEHGSR